jgi:DsbE subfamily thiol:disulfide oxidoreductase
MSRVPRIILMIALSAALALGLLAGCPGQPATNGDTTEPSENEVTTGPPEVGKPAPDFKLDALDGQTVVLSQLQGTPVLLNFWATWCGPCRSEMPLLQHIHEEGYGVMLLTVNVAEGSSDVSQFMDSYGFSFTVLLDQQAAVAQKYNVMGIPTSFFIDGEGIIREIKVGAFTNQVEIENILNRMD